MVLLLLSCSRAGLRSPSERPSNMPFQQFLKRQNVFVPDCRATERFGGVRPIVFLMCCSDRHQSGRGFVFLMHQLSCRILPALHTYATS